MDPNACLDRLLHALEVDADAEEAEAAAEDLLGWLARGGFEPRRSAEVEVASALADFLNEQGLEDLTTVGKLLDRLHHGNRMATVEVKMTITVSLPIVVGPEGEDRVDPEEVAKAARRAVAADDGPWKIDSSEWEEE